MFTKAIWAFLTFWRQICFKSLFLIQFQFPCREWSNFLGRIMKVHGWEKQPTYDSTVNLQKIQLKSFIFLQIVHYFELFMLTYFSWLPIHDVDHYVMNEFVLVQLTSIFML
jgi:hypothetical protein